ncbi:PQ-loop domain-containing transporter [Angustibacter aerolatus]
MPSAALLGQVLAYSAAVLGCFIAVPQVVRLVRTRAVEGISARSWQVATASNACWLAYGLRSDQPAQVLANVFGGAGGLLILWLVLSGPQRLRNLPPYAAVLAATAAAVLVAPSAWITLPLALTGLASRIPQMVVTWRTWRHDLPSGVSVATWALTVVVTLLWTASGVLAHDVAVIGSAGAACVTAALVLVAEVAPVPASWRARDLMADLELDLDLELLLARPAAIR